MVDGVHFADQLCVVALGIGIDGTKHPLGVVEGDTENTTVVKDLLVSLRDRGLDTTQPILCVLEGAKALVAAVKAVFDHPVVHRCQLHKVRNVESKLPKALASTVAKKMRAAYHDPDALTAEATLEALARGLAESHPGAAGSLLEGAVRHPHRHPARRATHAGPHAALHQRHRVEDRDLPGHSTNVKRGGTGKWRCVGAPPAWARRPSSSAGSTASSTCPPYAPHSRLTSTKLSHRRDDDDETAA